MKDPSLPNQPVMNPNSSGGGQSNDYPFRVGQGKSPQNLEFADKPGAFSLVSRMSRANVDPGDTLTVELFITGYGIIEGGKLLVYPSPGVFEATGSSITAGCRQIGESVTFGGTTWPMDQGGSIWIELNSYGVRAENWKRQTIFFDAIPDSHFIFTEGAYPWTPPTGQYHGPVTLSLKMKDEAKPGQYDVRFVLTYFNGESWVTCPETAQFSIRSWYQRHETFCQLSAVIGAVIALAALVAQLVK